MHGYIHLCLQSMVTRQNSFDAYMNLLRRAGLSEQTEWQCRANYTDDITFRLFHAYSAISQQTIEMVLEQFGEWFFSYAMEQKYDLLLKCQSDSLQGFLDNLSSFHYFLDSVVFQGESRGPSFRCESNQDGTLTLHYFSDRKSLYPMVKGLITHASEELFHQPIRMIVLERLQEKRRNLITEHVIFSISPIRPKDKLTPSTLKPIILNRRKGFSTGHISLESFCTAFPTHICFNKQMFIEHCGKFIQREFEVAGKRLVKLGDILVLVQPEDVPMSFKNFLTHLNSPFVFRSKHPLKRNIGRITSFSFTLKGQMILLNNAEHLLYMASPYFSTVHELFASNVFIGDMPIHDATRDLVLLNQNRISQKELNRKLEEAAESIHLMAIELEERRKRADLMHSDLLPPTISAQIYEDYTIAEEFPETTLMNIEISHFNLISNVLEAQKLVDLMNRVFQVYDRLIDLHECLKVYSVMESYFVIAGAPTYQPNHYERILNLALAMMYAVRTVNVPKIDLPLLIRISVHSGSILGMVTGKSRLKYTVLSEAVNITKRLSSYSEPGRILVTSIVKALASKSDQYTFQTGSYIKLSGNSNQATCTFWLEQHDHKSICELTGMSEVNNQDFDPHTIEKDRLAWANYYRQSVGLHEKKNGSLWRRLKEGLRTERNSQDSGISYETISSTTCSIQ